MSCGIYKITNLITSESYIGQSVNIERRFKEHCTSKDKCVIHIAINKYGKENFSFDIIEICEQKELNEKEIYWIKYYNTYYKGYNETLGGQTFSIINNEKINQYSIDGKYIKTFNSITEAERELNITYQGSQINAACSNKDNRKSAFGFQWKYYKDVNNIKDIPPLENYIDRARKLIYQYDKNDNLIAIYKNITDASIQTSIGRTSISNCLNGRSKMAGKYKWKKGQ